MFRSRLCRLAASRSALVLAPSARFVRVAPQQPAVTLAPAVAWSLRTYSDAPGTAPPGGPTKTTAYLLDKQDVLQRVLDIVKNFEKVDASKVTPESHFINDLGLDSLDVVEVVMAIEQEFILDIPDHEAEKIQSVPEAVEYIAQNPMAK